ncbi:MAG: hypothetical protein WD826_00600 [Actinomycetota bacterium]
MEDAVGTDRHDEKAIAFFGTWTIIGLYLDGWAHLHNKPETFFSPWHGVLYSGFTTAVIYFAFREYVLRKKSTMDDKLVAWGLALFIAGAVGDGVWHQIFGIEVDIEALLSPTHLMLLTGGLLMLSMPARNASKRNDGRVVSFGRFFPTIMSLTLTSAVAMFFTQYYAAHRMGGLFRDDSGGDFWVVHQIGAILITGALLVGPTLFAVRRWNTPLGTFTFFYAVIAFAVLGMDEFIFAPHIAAAAVAGLLTDILASVLRPSPDRRTQGLVFSALVPLAIFGCWYAAIYFMNGIHVAAEIWTGGLYLAVLEGLGLGALTFARPQAVAATPVVHEPLEQPVASSPN